MIVISRSLVLAPVVGEQVNSPLIGWRNIVTTSNLAADTEDSDYPAVNLANPSTALKWTAADTTDQYITITTNEVDPIDYLAVARHNFGTAAVTVSVEGRSETEGSPEPAFEELVEETLPADDSPLMMRFPAQSLAEIRLKMQPGSTAPTAAVIYVGRLLVLQRRFYVGHTPIKYGRRASITSGRSEAGNYLGRVVTGRYRETAVQLQNLTPAWYRSDLDPFISASEESPFFFAWRPTSYPREVGYAWLTNEPRPVNQRPNGMMQIDLQMAGIV